MKSLKLIFAYILTVLLMTFCNSSDVSYKDISVDKNDAIKPFVIKKNREITLDSGEDIVGNALTIDMIGEKILIADPYHSRKCYLFDANGKLTKIISRYGEGPGENIQIMAACFAGDRIFVIGVARINIYTPGGDLIKTLLKPFHGLCNSAYGGPDGNVYALSYNRYNQNKDTIYQLNKEGELVTSFAPMSGIPPVFDVYYPQTGLVVEETKLSQFFIFKYGLTMFDLKGNKIKNVTLSSPNYTPPDFEEAKTIKGHKEELKYRATFTQLYRVFKHSRGYLFLLQNWKTTKKAQSIFELRDNDFNLIGYCELSPEQFPVGVINDRLVAGRLDDDATRLIFWDIVL